MCSTVQHTVDTVCAECTSVKHVRHAVHANEFSILCHVTNDFWRSKFFVIKNMILWQNIWFVDIRNYINAFQFEYIKFCQEEEEREEEEEEKPCFSHNTENEIFLMSQSFAFILFFGCLNLYANNWRYLNTRTHSKCKIFNLYLENDFAMKTISISRGILSMCVCACLVVASI